MLECAKIARRSFYALGTPLQNDSKTIIKRNAIRNLPSPFDDINIAETACGTDIGALKGKTTRQKSAPVVLDYIEIPKELVSNDRTVTLCMDGIKVIGFPFFTIILRNIMYRTGEWIPNQPSTTNRSALDIVFRIFNYAGFRTTTINCDKRR